MIERTSDERGTTTDALSDDELLGAVRAGDLEAYGVLYRRHLGAARALARRSGGAYDPEGAVQEVFVRLLRVIQRGQGPREGFAGYLMRSVRNEVIDRARRAREIPVEDVAAVATDQSVVEDGVEQMCDRELVARAFATLPEAWQRMLWLTEVEGKPPRVVAAQLGQSANAVAQLSHRAREGLRVAWLQAHVQDVADSEECRSVAARLGAYERGRLSATRTAQVREHLDQCVRCRAALEELRSLTSRMHALLLPVVLASPALSGALVDAAGGAGQGLASGAALVGTGHVGGAAGPGAVGAAGWKAVLAVHGSSVAASGAASFVVAATLVLTVQPLSGLGAPLPEWAQPSVPGTTSSSHGGGALVSPVPVPPAPPAPRDEHEEPAPTDLPSLDPSGNEDAPEESPGSSPEQTPEATPEDRPDGSPVETGRSDPRPDTTGSAGTSDGVTTDGVTADGETADGVTTDGATADRETSDEEPPTAETPSSPPAPPAAPPSPSESRAPRKSAEEPRPAEEPTSVPVSPETAPETLRPMWQPMPPQHAAPRPPSATVPAPDEPGEEQTEQEKPGVLPVEQPLEEEPEEQPPEDAPVERPDEQPVDQPEPAEPTGDPAPSHAPPVPDAPVLSAPTMSSPAAGSYALPVALSGEGVPGAVVHVLDDQGQEVGSSTVTEDGCWSAPPVPGEPDTVTRYRAVQETEGETSEPSGWSAEITHLAPDILTPADGARITTHGHGPRAWFLLEIAVLADQEHVVLLDGRPYDQPAQRTDTTVQYGVLLEDGTHTLAVAYRDPRTGRLGAQREVTVTVD